MTRIPYRSRIHVARILSLSLIVIVLAGCGPSGTSTSTDSQDEEAAARDPIPTAEEGELTVGDLINRVNEAWPGVTSMRVTSTSGPVPTQSDAASSPQPQGAVTIEEWVAPNKRRIVELVGGTVTNEQIYVNGIVYMWGMFVGTSVAPEAGTQTWVQVDDIDAVPPDTPVGYRVSYITRGPDMPFSSISEGMRKRPARESGTVKVGGRTCTLYTFVDSTQLGDRIVYELALDDNNLPCQLVQRAGGFQNSSVYEINEPDIQIIAPDASTPVSGTPEG